MRNIILLLCIVINSVSSDHFTYFLFTATVECRIMKHWCVQLAYYEQDVVTPDDLIGETDWHCTRQQSQVIQMLDKEDGDGLYDDWYELYVEVRHNCRDDGNFVIFEKNLPDVETQFKSVPINFKVTI